MIKRSGGVVALAAVCAGGPAWAAGGTGSFGSDLALLRQKTDVVVLSDRSHHAQVAVVPRYQGRVMTSTASGPGGVSFGWINADLIASGKRTPHMNAFGGEDRIWFGPEGGQFGMFFAPGAPFDVPHWQTPEAVDWGGWPVVQRRADSVSFRRVVALTNRSGTRFNMQADRQVRLLSDRQIATDLACPLGRGVHAVGYETINVLTNRGPQPWTRAGGLPSIWILGQFNPSPTTTIVIPFRPGPESRLGRIVNDAYFGKVPADRLVVRPAQGVLYFKADGKHRSKIGIPPQRARDILGSYDATHRVLTLVQYNRPIGANGFVNSMWEMQKAPFAGDEVNSYNDGPMADGTQLGPFYELETSSRAADLRAGASLRHIHRTIHLQGSERDLDRIARRTLGVGLSDITKAFK